MDIPRDFFIDGTQFINRCTKGTIFFPPGLSSGLSQGGRQLLRIGHETTINESACANFFYSGPPRIYKDPPPTPSRWCWIPRYGRNWLFGEIKLVTLDPSVAIEGMSLILSLAVHIPVNNILVGGA
jgi:hypothetical protein